MGVLELDLEQAVTLEEMGKRLRKSRVTMWTWATEGLRGVKLKSWKLGNRRVTTMAAVQQFTREYTEAVDRMREHRQQLAASIRTTAQQERRAEAAMKRLQARGLA
jgi:hypothetical protein